MDLFSAMKIASRGLTAQRIRMNVVASNLSNAQTTRTQEGGAYKRRDVVMAAVRTGDVFAEQLDNELAQKVHAVSVVDIKADDSPGQRIFNPNHPDSDGEGYVTMPNVSVVEEMVNMVTATREYEANVQTLSSLGKMGRAALMIIA
jgi:flagellar basal-body rod protein FlgC